jgi:5-methylcytosine-specific restriction endonuclease McrA
LGISSTGGKSGGKYGFQFKARNDFNRLEVYFKKKAVGLYLLINSTDDQYVEEVKINLSDKLREPFTWPESGNRINRAFNVNLETIGQYESVIEWLSSERVPNTRRLSFLENKTAKLKSEKPQLFEPTSDNEKLEANTSRLLESGLDEEPSGNPNPERSDPRESKGAFKRDPEVIAWVKQRAEGICELCEKEGPFLDKDNHPFLEVHHIVSLADGGSDKVDNAVAICPNCHRECHHGSNPEVLKLALLKKLQP